MSLKGDQLENLLSVSHMGKTMEIPIWCARIVLSYMSSVLQAWQLFFEPRFPTMWYVRLAKPQISLRIRAV